MSKKQSITIIGAGPTGLFLALLFAKRGFKVEIFDRLSLSQICTDSSSRSFSISFFKRGLEAMEKVDIADEIANVAVFLQGSTVHPPYADKVHVDHDTKNNSYIAIKRSTVVEVLLKETKKYSSISIHYDTVIMGIDRNNKHLMLQHVSTQEYSTHTYAVLFGADGANSKVRTALFEGQNTHFNQKYEEWKYKQVSLSASTAKLLGMEINRMHIWPHEKAMLAFFPNRDGSMSGMISMQSFNQLSTPQGIQQFIKNTFPQLYEAKSEIVESMIQNREGRFVSIHMKPWYYNDSIVLLGDAVHAALPSLGQGMTAGFEDALAIIDLVDTYNTDWKRIFPQYEEKRKRHADVLVDASQKSFSKFLRHKKADYEAIYDRVDDLLARLFPHLWYPPFFKMMSHSSFGFADIQAIHARQRRLGNYLGISFAVAVLTVGIHYSEIFLSPKKH